LRPLAHVLARLGDLAGEVVHAVETSRPDAALGLASQERLLLVNITPAPQTVALPAQPRRVSLIGGDTADVPAGEQIAVPPYGCIEVVF